ncbi:hypothetical protein [Acetobacterium malicum]|uniref:hypothetical protein n=1 Tax=Acetobacterium malicum TaxID=52692 RepID=UPI0003FEBC14|nr:hypothetical protein [Acetobacterium dehalogenans]
MTMTIEKIEFPRRETKQSKTKKSLTIDSDDEPVETVEEIDPVSEQLQETDKSFAKSATVTATINESISAIQTAFENHLMEDGKGSATIASYTGDIKGFTLWLDEKKIFFQPLNKAVGL